MVYPYFNATSGSIYAAAAVTIVASFAPAAHGQETFELNEQTFNQWLFSASQGSFDTDSELKITVEAVDRACGLSEPQKDKLQLAGRGDYARFEQRVDELRAKYVGKTYAQDEIGKIYQEIQPLGQIYQTGLLGESSLFSKVLARSLTPEQAKEFDRIEAARRQARYKAKIGLFVATLERSCPLADKQRTALVELLLAETKPPKRFGQYDWYVIMYQASRIPDERYQQIVDEAQLRQLQQAVRQGAGMEQFLRQQNILAD